MYGYALEGYQRRSGKDKLKMKNEKLKIILVLDTADSQEITVGLIIDGRKDIQTKKVIFNKTQIILPMVDKILKKHLLAPKDLSEIQINLGPGSFTGLRIGLAIANALSFVLKVPVNGKKAGEIILPIYSSSAKSKQH